MAAVQWRSWAPEVATGHEYVYLLTATPGHVEVDDAGEEVWVGDRLTTPEAVDEFVEKLRSLLRAAARTDRGPAALAGGFYRFEAVAHPEEGDVGPCPCTRLGKVWECPICDGSRRLPVVHYHVHVVAWSHARLWFGYGPPPPGHVGIGGLGLWGAAKRRGLGRVHARAVTAEDAVRYVGKFGAYAGKCKDAALAAVYSPARSGGKFGSARGATREAAGELLLSPEGERRNQDLISSMTEKAARASSADRRPSPGTGAPSGGDALEGLPFSVAEGWAPRPAPGWALAHLGGGVWSVGESPERYTCREALRAAKRRNGIRLLDDEVEAGWAVWWATLQTQVGTLCECDEHRAARGQDAEVQAHAAANAAASEQRARASAWDTRPEWVTREGRLWFPAGVVPEGVPYWQHEDGSRSTGQGPREWAAFLAAYDGMGSDWLSRCGGLLAPAEAW